MTEVDSTSGTGDARRHADPAVFNLTLDRNSSIPAYQQLKFHIIHAVSTGRLQPDDIMPSVREASERFGLAPATVQRTYGELKKEGILSSKPGQHVYVSHVEGRVEPEKDGNRKGSLQDLLVPVYVNARAMGFTDAEILETFEELSSSRSNGRGRPRLAFVGEGERVLDKYLPILSDALSALDAEVVGLDLDKLVESDGALLDEYAPIQLIVSIVSWMGAVREFALKRDIPIVGLLVEPTPETKRILAELPYGAKIGLISEPRYVTNVGAIIEQLCGGNEIQIVSAVEASPAARRRIAGCDVFVHTFRTEELAASLVPEGVEVTEFRFQPVRASLDHIEALLLKFWLESDETGET